MRLLAVTVSVGMGLCGSDAARVTARPVPVVVEPVVLMTMGVMMGIPGRIRTVTVAPVPVVPAIFVGALMVVAMLVRDLVIVLMGVALIRPIPCQSAQVRGQIREGRGKQPESP